MAADASYHGDGMGGNAQIEVLLTRDMRLLLEGEKRRSKQSKVGMPLEISEITRYCCTLLRYFYDAAADMTRTCGATRGRL